LHKLEMDECIANICCAPDLAKNTLYSSWYCWKNCIVKHLSAPHCWCPWYHI